MTPNGRAFCLQVLRLACLTLAASVGIACGSASPTAPSDTSSSTAGVVSARLDGAAFRASSVARAEVSGGSTAVTGAQGAVGVRFSFTASAPGTYPIQSAAIVNGDLSWSVNGSFGRDGSNGTVTLTRISATRAVGTFQMTAVQPSSRAVLRITEGTFDVPVQ